jgi:hypothetical protein
MQESSACTRPTHCCTGSGPKPCFRHVPNDLSYALAVNHRDIEYVAYLQQRPAIVQFLQRDFDGMLHVYRKWWEIAVGLDRDRFSRKVRDIASNNEIDLAVRVDQLEVVGLLLERRIPRRLRLPDGATES